ncbi:hypothetical protein SDC9_159906 [bioreactor metagenome]|uniref:Uncharacterized protein n=1 Tax=bioreactor metagenome TaxID=1076179 RepID=A0A645FDW0_9ZZZZ
MIGIEVWTNPGINTRRAFALLTNRQVSALHLVHIGRRAAQIADVSFKIGHPGNFLYFFEDRFFRP